MRVDDVGLQVLEGLQVPEICILFQVFGEGLFQLAHPLLRQLLPQVAFRNSQQHVARLTVEVAPFD